MEEDSFDMDKGGDIYDEETLDERYENGEIDGYEFGVMKGILEDGSLED